MNIFELIFGLSLLTFFGFFYCKNIYKLYLNIQEEKYSLMTIARVVGVFFPFVGFFLGFV